MANKPKICVVGSANMDLVVRSQRLPRPGETLVGHGFHMGFGGKGANQAVMTARLGAKVALIGRVGRDLFGDQTLTHLAQEGIDTEHVSVDDQNPTGVAAIVVDDAAENAIIVVPGANARLSPDDVRRAVGAIQAASVVLCQLVAALSVTRPGTQASFPTRDEVCAVLKHRG